jgi:hypothetical protein
LAVECRDLAVELHFKAVQTLLERGATVDFTKISSDKQGQVRACMQEAQRLIAETVSNSSPLIPVLAEIVADYVTSDPTEPNSSFYQHGAKRQRH